MDAVLTANQIRGWVTDGSVLRALARQISGAHYQATQAPVPVGRDDDEARSPARHASVPQPGYRVAGIRITEGSPAAGRKLPDVRWPQASTPLSALSGRRLRATSPEITLIPGDRVSLLIPVLAGSLPQNSPPQHPRVGGHAVSSESSSP